MRDSAQFKNFLFKKYLLRCNGICFEGQEAIFVLINLETNEIQIGQSTYSWTKITNKGGREVEENADESS